MRDITNYVGKSTEFDPALFFCTEKMVNPGEKITFRTSDGKSYAGLVTNKKRKIDYETGQLGGYKNKGTDYVYVLDVHELFCTGRDWWDKRVNQPKSVYELFAAYERKLPFIANSYMPFGQEAYERGRHYVHIFKATDNKWKFRVYRYGKPKSSLTKIAKAVLTKMQAPLQVLGQMGADAADWGLWVQKVISNRYTYTWTEFYFSEHNIPASSPWATKGMIKGPLWADVDPLALIDMRIYDRAEQEYGSAKEYERRIVAEDYIDNFFDAPGQIDELRNKLYSAIKEAPLGQQILCENCYHYNSIDPSSPSVIKCQSCGKDLDTSAAKKAKKTLTYDTVKEYVNKKASSLKRLFVAQANNEYWVAILGDGTKMYDSEEALLGDIEKEIDSLSTQTITEETKEMLDKEMPSIDEIKKAVLKKFEELEIEQDEEEYALVANLNNYKQTLQVIESIDSRGLSKEAQYLKDIIKRNGKC